MTEQIEPYIYIIGSVLWWVGCIVNLVVKIRNKDEPIIWLILPFAAFPAGIIIAYIVVLFFIPASIVGILYGILWLIRKSLTKSTTHDRRP